MKILIYDTECSGLDVEQDYVQELAWAIYDVESWRLLSSQSYLINWPRAYDVHPEAEAVTGLSKDFCNEYGQTPKTVLPLFLFDVGFCDYICGHNAIGFDHPMMKHNIKRGLLFDVEPDHVFNKVPHIDTLIDCPFPANMKIHSLKYLALDHGYILSNAHQAMSDVFACKAILEKYDFKTVSEIAKTKLITITAKVDFNNLDGREKIKNSRFYWSPKRKLWEKRIREYYLKNIQLELEGLDVKID